MIGGSGKVNSGNYHKHEVTKCIHESGAAKIEDGGKMRAGMNASSSLIRQERKTFSLQEWLTDGMRDLLSRVSGFWRKMGEEGTGEELQCVFQHQLPISGSDPGRDDCKVYQGTAV